MSLDAAVTAPARFWAPPIFPAATWYFALSTAAAAVLALYAAFVLQLDSPGSAMTTVLIVASPLHGMVLSKSLWRIIGTVIGLIMSIVLIAAADQAPWLFILWLGLWLGLCTFVSSYLRYFRAYAAVLAGYTVSLVALPAVEQPDQIFALATSRLAVVMIGILSLALVKSVFAFGIGRVRLRPALRGALLATGQFATRALELMPDLAQQRRVLAERLNALDPLVHAAANESAETALQAPSVRLFVMILFNITTLVAGMHDTLAAIEAAGALPAPLAAARAAVRDLVRALADADLLIGPAGAGLVETVRQLLAEKSAELAAELAAERNPAALQNLALAIRFEDIAEEIARARDTLIDIERGRSGRQVTPITYHRDTTQAVINASRGALATFAGGAFWIFSAWPSGSSMLSLLMVVSVLLGTADRPDLAALGFLRGILLAGLVAFACVFFVLTRIEGFPLLALTLAVVVTSAALISTLPKHTGSATAFLIFFSTFLGLGNPMPYAPIATLNFIGAAVVGAMVAVVAFRILWPANPERVVRRIMRSIVEDLGGLARRRDVPALTVWESRMVDRVARLGTRLAQSPRRPAVVEGGLAALQIGRELMRARRMLAPLHLPPALEASIERAREADHHMAASPERAAAATAQAVQDLLAAATAAPSETGSTQVPADEAGALLRIAASLHAVSELLSRHRSFFQLTVLDETEAA